jgi:hypothetical protein
VCYTLFSSSALLTYNGAGYTPFDRETQQLEMEAIIAGDFQFKPGKLFLMPFFAGVKNSFVDN